MNDLLRKISECISKYKWLLIPGIPLFLFLALLVLITIPQPASEQLNQTSLTQPTVFPTASQSESISPTSITPEADTPFSYGHGADIDEPLESREDYQSKEDFENGTTKYVFTSATPSRPNIMILQGEEIVFNREITDPELGTTLDDYVTIYGDPDELLKAPAIYGPEAVVYYYKKQGAAIIGNANTNTVFESHIFPPMNSKDYQDRFSEYIQ